MNVCRISRAVFTLAVVAVAAGQSVKAQLDIQEATKEALRTLHKNVVKVLSGDAAKSAAGVKMRYLAGDWSHGLAVAVARGSERTVFIAEGLAFGLHAYTTAVLMEDVLQKPGLSQAYARHMFDGPSYDGFKLQPVAEFARLSPGEEAKFEKWDDENDLVARAFLGSLQFIIAHELAHHVLGRYADPASARATLRNERACDKWAVRTMVRCQIAPASGVFAMMYLHELECYGVDVGRERTHPGSLDRAFLMIDETIAAADDLPQHDGRQLKTNARRMRQIVRAYRDSVLTTADEWEAFVKEEQEAQDRAVAREEAAIENGDDHNANRWRRAVGYHSRRLGEASLRLGRFYQTGSGGVEKDEGAAYGHFACSSACGNHWGTLWTATALRHGWGVDVNEKLARSLLRGAADRGFKPARVVLNSWK